MISNKLPIAAVLAAVTYLASPLASAVALTGQDALSRFDTDHDGTLSQKEAVRAADARFRALDQDADGTLDAKEAEAAGITKSEFDKADRDKDGTLDKKEFNSIVVSRFKQANADSDRTLDAKELDSPPGQALVQLLH